MGAGGNEWGVKFYTNFLSIVLNLARERTPECDLRRIAPVARINLEVLL